MIVVNRSTFRSQVQAQIDHGNQTFAFLAGRAGRQIWGSVDNNEAILSSEVEILEDDYFLQHESILVRPESFIYELLSDFILRYTEHGIDEIVDQNFKKHVRDSKVVLTMSLLSAGFTIWLCSVCLANVFFIVEFIYGNYIDKN